MPELSAVSVHMKGWIGVAENESQTLAGHADFPAHERQAELSPRIERLETIPPKRHCLGANRMAMPAQQHVVASEGQRSGEILRLIILETRFATAGSVSFLKSEQAVISSATLDRPPVSAPLDMIRKLRKSETGA